MALIKCAYCDTMFEKKQARITETEKLGKQHACNRKCASALTNETRRCEPATINARNTRRDKEIFPEKDLARSLVRRAVKTGKLILPTECEFCGDGGRIEWHHPDHSKPFLLICLCKDCHHTADADPDKWISLATDYSGCITQ